MNTPERQFSEASFAKAKLLQDAIYREDAELWEALRQHRDEIRHYFLQIGQELVVDDAEGFAFLRQFEMEGDERIPRLSQRRKLGYDATLLLVCLREEYCRFDSSVGDSTRLVRSRQEVHTLVASFLRETNNQVKDVKAVDTAIQRLVELGFVRQNSSGDRDDFEIMRIVKARITPSELEAVRDRLLHHGQSGT